MQLTRLGVIDLGSNSGRLVLAIRQANGIPEIVDESQVSLRLAEGLQATGEISPAAAARARDALRAFKVMTEQFGAERVITVGTSALRDAANGAAVAAELERDTGLAVDILSGEREAFYAYLAAVNSLPFDDGLVLDLGGGSLELAVVRGRACERVVSLPFGTLRMTEQFLKSDPPAAAEVDALRRHVGERLRKEKLRPLKGGQSLVGLGGTVRNLAKLARKGAGDPSLRLHGYVVETSRIVDLARSLARLTAAERGRMPGLPLERAGPIVAGALVVREVLQAVKAPTLIACGQGLREGLAFEAFREGEEPVLPDVRRAGLDAFRRRYRPLQPRSSADGPPAESAFPASASRESDVEELALRLLGRLEALGSPEPGDRELLAAAAALCDTGRTISLYRWPEHTLYLLANGDLTGYTQPEALLIAQVIAAQSGQRVDLSGYGTLVKDGDEARVGRLGIVLGLARWLSRAGVVAATPVSVLAQGQSLVIVLPPGVPVAEDEWHEGLARACRRSFERELRVTHLGD